MMPVESPKPYREVRPWGEFVKFTENSPCTVKIMTVNPGEAFSLQYHHNRDEFWHIISGSGSLEIGSEHIDAVAGSDHFVPKETNHRIIGGQDKLVILEITFGEFDENDIVRLEDRYGRVK